MFAARSGRSICSSGTPATEKQRGPVSLSLPLHPHQTLPAESHLMPSAPPVADWMNGRRLLSVPSSLTSKAVMPRGCRVESVM